MSPARGEAARGRQLLGTGALGLFIIVGCSGCMTGIPPISCTAVGYFSTVEVILEGSASTDVERIAVCTEGGCSTHGLEATPSPTNDMTYSATELKDERWQVDFTTVPEEATIEVFAADGTMLGSTATGLEWRRVGGSEQCGGPQEADPIIVNTD